MKIGPEIMQFTDFAHGLFFQVKIPEIFRTEFAHVFPCHRITLRAVKVLRVSLRPISRVTELL